MDASESDETTMLSTPYFQSDDRAHSTSRVFSTSNRSVSMPSPSNCQDSSKNEHNLARFTGPSRNERRTSFVQMSDPSYVNSNREFVFQPPQDALKQKVTNPKIESGHQKHKRTSDILDAKFHTILYRDAKGWGKRISSFLCVYIPPVMNRHAKVVQWWYKFFVFSCLFAAILDPLFFFLLSMHEENKCMVFSWHMATTFVISRSMTDFIYLIHILLQFRLAYVNPKSGIMGVGDIVDDPRKVARNYFFGYFGIDFFVVLPLPQIIVLLILMGVMSASYAKGFLQLAILVQYVPRFCNFVRLLASSSPTGFIFESIWTSFVISPLTIVLFSHVVGSCWYLFGLKRVNQCFRAACLGSNITRCMDFMDCGLGNDYREFENDPTWDLWKTNENARACFGKESFDFGIYEHAVNLTTNKSIWIRYVYSFFWGFQQISTMAGNQVPSYFVWEVLFTISITGLGLIGFALLIGNMQNFQGALGRRTLEISLRRRDVEQWMRHRRLPEELKRQVRDAERFNWAATRGINEEMLMENLPEDLQRAIRRHLFKFVKKVRIFQQLDEPIIDAICERLRTKTYIKGSKIMFRGGLVDKMVFIIRGKIESIGEDLSVVPLSEGDVCGEELLTWCLQHYSVNKDGRKIRIPGPILLSNRLVRCLTNVEAFVLRAADLEEVTSLFARFLRSPRVQGAIRNESPYRRGLTARRFQVAWRYRKRQTS